VNTVTCDGCQTEYGIGQSPFCRDAHAWVDEYHPFVPRFDIALGRYTATLADRWKGMREKNLDYAPRKVGDPRCEI
jgi:hypothetical protein